MSAESIYTELQELLFNLFPNNISSCLYALASGIVIRYILWKSSKRQRLIGKIPGIKDYPIVGDIFHFCAEPSEFYVQARQFVEERRQHKIMKIKVLEVPKIVLFSPGEVKILLDNSELICKAKDYQYLGRFLGPGILTSDGQKWKSRRKMLVSCFHFHILQDFLHIMNEHAGSLVDILGREACDTGREYDIFQDLTWCSLDIICATAMGVHIDALNDSESEYVKAVYHVKNSIVRRPRTPLYWYDVVYDQLPTGRKANSLIDVAHKFTHQVIKERRDLIESGDYVTGKYRPLLDLLLQHSNDHTGQRLSDEEIRAEVDTFMFAGHDTTSAALGFTTYLLGAHPEIQQQCHKEVEEVMGGRIEITKADLHCMPYLECCIKESMRLFPPVPIFGRNLAKDTDFAGFTVPKDVGVYVFTSCLHQDPEIYPDPQKFDPTRFTPENCHNRHPYAYIPFSAGPRNCIGLKFAMMELKVVLASILLNFNIEATQTREELRPSPGLILQPTAGIKVKLTSRQE